MKRVFLQNNKGFNWHSSKNCYVKGYLFDSAGDYFSDEKLLSYFTEIQSFSDFEERVKYANGSFAVVYKSGEELYAATDSIRSFPIFYLRIKGNWMVSDNANFLRDHLSKAEINSVAMTEFLAAGYVTGNETLIEGIRQVQAGEVINFKDDEIYSKFYFSYRIANSIEEPYDKLKEAGLQVFERAFNRLVKSLEGRTALVPLSGGYDSRMIALMLKKHNYQDVICFTYGRKDNSEQEISQKVAESLGFKWIFIEYNEELIKDFTRDEVFQEYYPWGSNLSSMFYLQEFFAVKYLRENKLIPEDSVFIPGHSGDFLGGSQLNKHGNFSMEESLEDISDRIFNIKYCYVRPDKKDVPVIIERIRKNLQEKFVREADLAYTIHEDWDFKEKLAKFNFNSNTIYTFFGYEFRIPYWDHELVDFFKNLPISAKLNKYLYDDILTHDYFEDFNLNFRHELQPSEKDLKKVRVKQVIKKSLPPVVTDKLVKKKDVLFYNEITRILLDELKGKGKNIKFLGNSYNSIIIQWYAEDLKSKI